MVAKSTVALTDVKLISYLKLNIFEVFFVVITIRVKSRIRRGVAGYMELLKGVVNRKRLRNTGLQFTKKNTWEGANEKKFERNDW